MGAACTTCEPCSSEAVDASKHLDENKYYYIGLAFHTQLLSQVRKSPFPDSFPKNSRLEEVRNVLEDGSVYQGETKDGVVRHGFGTYTYPDGKTYYKGAWREGKAHGEGVFCDEESEYKIGFWEL